MGGRGMWLGLLGRGRLGRKVGLGLGWICIDTPYYAWEKGKKGLAMLDLLLCMVCIYIYIYGYLASMCNSNCGNHLLAGA